MILAIRNCTSDCARGGENWIVRPKVGLGKLRLGMERGEIDEFDPVYGMATSRFRHAGVAEIIPSTLELLGDALSEEDRRYIEDVYAPEIAKSDLSSVVLSEGGLALDFTAERLTGIIGGDPVATVRLLDAGDERFQERTIGLSASAEELGEERQYWRPHSW